MRVGNGRPRFFHPARVNASTSNEFTRFYFSSLKENFLEAFELYKNLILSFNLTQEALDKEVGVVCNEIGNYKDQNWSVVYDGFYSCFKKHPISHPILGYEDVLKSLSVKDVQSYYDTFYTSEALTFFICGNLDMESYQTVLNSLSTIPFKSKIPRVTISELHTKPIIKNSVQYKDINQTFLFSAIPVKGDFFLHLTLIGIILGGTMSSYLWNEFREKRSIAYTIGASPSSLDSKTLLLTFYTALDDSSNVDLSIELFKDSIAYCTSISEEEYNKALITYRTEVAISRQKISSIVDDLEDEIYFGYEDVSFDRQDRAVRELTYDSFIKFAKTLNSEELVTSILYPKEVQN